MTNSISREDDDLEVLLDRFDEDLARRETTVPLSVAECLLLVRALVKYREGQLESLSEIRALERKLLSVSLLAVGVLGHQDEIVETEHD